MLFKFTTPARLSLKALPKDRTLLDNLFSELQRVADNPQEWRHPPPFPNRQDRYFNEFVITDSEQSRWFFGVLLLQQADHVLFSAFQFSRYSRYEHHLGEDDPDAQESPEDI